VFGKWFNLKYVTFSGTANVYTSRLTKKKKMKIKPKNGAPLTA